MSHRRRGVGVGRSGASKYAQKKADEMKAVSLQSAIDTVEKLEVKLTEFAKLHQKEIKDDPAIRQRFLSMCAPLGIDPLQSDKSFWGHFLGMSDFYHELAVKVAEVCIASRPRNGGIISITEVQSVLSKRKTRLGMTNSGKATIVSAPDIAIAIQKLSKLGGGFRTVEMGHSTMIVSVPKELGNDVMQVMTAANEKGRGVTLDDMVEMLQWKRSRVERAIEMLLQEGMAWLDQYKGVRYYWFPASWQEEQAVGSG